MPFRVSCLARRGARRSIGPLLQKRFFRDESGGSAVEFAMIAAPFLAILFAILETGLVFFAGQSMESAVEQASRMIRTGQAAAFTQAGFKNIVCANILATFDCANGLKLDVRTYNDFASVDLSRPPVKNGKLQVNEQFNPGTGGDIVVVRAFYEWPTVINFFSFNLADLPGNKRLLSSTVAFRNEPF